MRSSFYIIDLSGMPFLECPTCGRRVDYLAKEDVPFRPFCSKRCKLVDLHKWLNEEYRVSEELSLPGVEPAEGNGEAEGEADLAGE